METTTFEEPAFLNNNRNLLVTHIYYEFPEVRNAISSKSYSTLDDIKRAERPIGEEYRVEKIKLCTNNNYMYALFTANFIKVYHINSINTAPAFFATDLNYL